MGKLQRKTLNHEGHEERKSPKGGNPKIFLVNRSIFSTREFVQEKNWLYFSLRVLRELRGEKGWGLF